MQCVCVGRGGGGAVSSNKDETEGCFILAPYQKVTVTAEAKN